DLREFPEKLSYALGLSGGGNTQTTFQDFNTYRGGNWDYLGLGEDFRALPDEVPDDKINNASLRRFAIGRSFKDIWSPQRITAPPNTGMNFTIGDTLGNLGLSVAGVYTTEYKHRTEIDRQFVNGGTGNTIKLADNFHYDNSVFETRVGGLATAAYKFDSNNKLTLRGLLNRNSTDQVLAGSGVTDQFRNVEEQTQLRYTAEELAFGQLAGEHRFPWLQLDWRTAFSRTTQDVPDTRFITYIDSGAPGSPRRFSEDSLGGSRIFGDLSEILSDSAMDFTIPFK